MELREFKIVPCKYRKHEDVYIQIPIRGSKFSAGYDFYNPCDIVIKPNKQIVIWTDICAYMPDDEFLAIYVRSSVGIKKNLMLSNTTGIIDKDYFGNESNYGNIGICLYNYGESEVKICAGERIAQGIFQKYFTIDVIVDNKRNGGIGSTN